MRRETIVRLREAEQLAIELEAREEEEKQQQHEEALAALKKGRRKEGTPKAARGGR